MPDEYLTALVILALFTAGVTWRFRPRRDPHPILSAFLVIGLLGSNLWLAKLAWDGKASDDARLKAEGEFQTFVRDALKQRGPEGEACLKIQEPTEQRACASSLLSAPSPAAAARFDGWLRRGQGALADSPDRATELVDGIATGTRHAHLGFRSIRCMVLFDDRGNPSFADRCVVDRTANLRFGPTSERFSSPFECADKAEGTHCQTTAGFTYWIRDRQETGRLFLSLVKER